MKAVVVEELGKMVVKEVPEPKLLPQSLRVRVEACAICGSDLRIFKKGDKRASLPQIIGHEIAGVVEEMGDRLDGYSVGDRVTIAPGHGCGECKYCRNGMGNVCINPHPSIGYASSGGFAQYIVPPVNVVANGFVNQIPDNLSFDEASMAELLACCINGQERAEVHEGDTVLIMGAGPAGCMHIQLARARGASKVMITQRSKPRLELAQRFGPEVTICGAEEDVVERVKAETDGLGADVIIVAAPSREAQEQAFQMIAPRGRVNFFGGLPAGENMITIDANLIHYIECFATGASSSLGRQNREALQLISEGKVKAADYITHVFGLDDILQGFAVVERKEGIKVVIKPWQ